MLREKKVNSYDWKSDLDADSAESRWKATNYLKRRGSQDTEAVQALSLALDDSNAFVRQNAATALRGSPKANRALSQLKEALCDEEKEVRLATLLTLRHMGLDARPALDNIIQCLNDTTWEVRFFASHLLGLFVSSEKSAEMALRAAAKDEVSLVQAAANEALRKLQ